MKRILAVLIAFTMAHVPVVAQYDEPVVPRWAPASGYWVAESNVQQPKQYTICFYNDDHVLVYKERIEGVKLNLASPRVKMRLKKVLKKSLRAWQKNPEPKENEGLVINLLQAK